jgi:hypothetical protein
MYHFRLEHDRGEECFIILPTLDQRIEDVIIQSGEQPPVVGYMNKEVVVNNDYCWEYLE